MCRKLGEIRNREIERERNEGGIGRNREIIRDRSKDRERKIRILNGFFLCIVLIIESFFN